MPDSDTIKHEITETVEWSYKFFEDLSLNADPCPYCNKEGLFNAIWESDGQYAQLADKKHEKGKFALDDCHGNKLLFVRCFNCNEILLDKLYE